MEIERLLAEKINMPEVRMIARRTTDSEEVRAVLWTAVSSPDRRTGVNALWVMTHLPPSMSPWLKSLQNEMADMLVVETDTARKRMLLQLLREQEYNPETLRTDLIDFCLKKINSESETYAVRAFSIYLALRMCCHYPELLGELKEHLEMLSFQPLSPGLKCARAKTMARIKRLECNQQ